MALKTLHRSPKHQLKKWKGRGTNCQANRPQKGLFPGWSDMAPECHVRLHAGQAWASGPCLTALCTLHSLRLIACELGPLFADFYHFSQSFGEFLALV